MLPLSRERKKLAADDYEVVMYPFNNESDSVLEHPPSDEEELVEDFRVAKERKRLYVMEREKTRPGISPFIKKIHI